MQCTYLCYSCNSDWTLYAHEQRFYGIIWLPRHPGIAPSVCIEQLQQTCTV